MALWGWDWTAIGAWTLAFAGLIVAPIAGIVGAVIGAQIGTRDARQRWAVERRDAQLAAVRAAALEVAESGYVFLSATFNYGRTQVGVRWPETPPDGELADALGIAQTRHTIAFAAFYATVTDPTIEAAGRTLEALRPGVDQFLGDDLFGVLNGDAAAMKRALERLILGYDAYRKGIEAYVAAIAPLVAPQRRL